MNDLCLSSVYKHVNISLTIRRTRMWGLAATSAWGECVCVCTHVLVHMCAGMYTKASWKSSNWVKVVEK